MLEMKNVTRKYNKVPVVNNVSMQLRRGEILGYLGPNGAGKSTTVKMLAGLVEPTWGSILLDGKSVLENSIGYKENLGYVPEQCDLYSHMSGLEYLELVGKLRRIEQRELDYKISGLMEQLGLEVDQFLPIANYSKGMGQKILIAAAILHNPDVLLLDEPFSGLDISSTLVIKDLLKMMAQEGKIILYSSHVLEVVEKICDRVIIINKGEICADDSVGNLSNLMKLPSLEAIFREVILEQNTSRTAEKIFSCVRGVE